MTSTAFPIANNSAAGTAQRVAVAGPTPNCHVDNCPVAWSAATTVAPRLESFADASVKITLSPFSASAFAASRACTLSCSIVILSSVGWPRIEGCGIDSFQLLQRGDVHGLHGPRQRKPGLCALTLYATFCPVHNMAATSLIWWLAELKFPPISGNCYKLYGCRFPELARFGSLRNIHRSRILITKYADVVSGQLASSKSTGRYAPDLHVAYHTLYWR